jgi:hypothetical protein
VSLSWKLVFSYKVQSFCESPFFGYRPSFAIFTYAAPKFAFSLFHTGIHHYFWSLRTYRYIVRGFSLAGTFCVKDDRLGVDVGINFAGLDVSTDPLPLP